MTGKLARLMAVVILAGIILTLVHPLPAAPGGKGKDRILSKITFIHFRKGHAKPPWAGGGKDDKGEEGFYDYIARGTKWKVTEDIRLNPICGENLDGSLDGLITDAVLAGLDEWETPGEASLTIFGDLIIDDNVSYDGGAYRGCNTLSFGGYSNPGVIAVTTVWGYFTGPPPGREIIEAHILMNDDFEWGNAAIDDYLMDIQNIVTHELGHWAGMGDVYELAAGEETMYGYSGEGETKKRDLYYGDITGITGLYK